MSRGSEKTELHCRPFNVRLPQLGSDLQLFLGWKTQVCDTSEINVDSESTSDPKTEKSE